MTNNRAKIRSQIAAANLGLLVPKVHNKSQNDPIFELFAKSMSSSGIYVF